MFKRVKDFFSEEEMNVEEATLITNVQSLEKTVENLKKQIDKLDLEYEMKLLELRQNLLTKRIELQKDHEKNAIKCANDRKDYECEYHATEARKKIELARLEERRIGLDKEVDSILKLARQKEKTIEERAKYVDEKNSMIETFLQNQQRLMETAYDDRNKMFSQVVDAQLIKISLSKEEFEKEKELLKKEKMKIDTKEKEELQRMFEICKIKSSKKPITAEAENRHSCYDTHSPYDKRG